MGLVSILRLRGATKLTQLEESESGTREQAPPSHLSGVVLRPFHLQGQAGLPRAMVTKRDSVHGNLCLQLLSPASPPTGQSAPGEPTRAAADWSSGSDVTAKRCQDRAGGV